MLPSLTISLVACVVALVAACAAGVGLRRVAPTWAYPGAVAAGLAVGWATLFVRGNALTLIGMYTLLTLSWAAIGALVQAVRLPRVVQLVAALATLAVFFVVEYRRGDMYAIQCGLWTLVGLAAFFGVTFVSSPVEPVALRQAQGPLVEPTATTLVEPVETTPVRTLALLAPLAGLYFAIIAHRLPNPGLEAYALIVTAASLAAYLATVRRGRPVPGSASFVMAGVLFTLGLYAWLGYASPDMAMAPVVILVADAVFTLGRRAVTGRVLGTEPTLGRRLLGILDAQDDSVWQRTATLDGVRAANADLLGASVIAMLLGLGEWVLKVAAVPGIVPFAVLAVAYVATPGVRSWWRGRLPAPTAMVSSA